MSDSLFSICARDTPLVSLNEMRLAVQNGGVGILERKDAYGRTALMLAARHAREYEVRLLAVERKADVNKAGEDWKTALVLAAWNGHEGVVRLLAVECKADVNKADADGVTALELAARNWHLCCVWMPSCGTCIMGISSVSWWN